MLSGEYKFDRSYNAIMTPFKLGQEEVDEQALRSLLRYGMQDRRWVKDCLGAICVNPGCGEVFFLSRQEKVRNVEIAREEVGDAPLFAGVVAPTTKATVEEAKAVMSAGADGLFLFPPANGALRFNPITEPEVWFDQIDAIFDAVGPVPAIPHAATPPGFWRSNSLPPATVIAMCNRFPNIVGWKMLLTDYTGLVMVHDALRSLDHHVGVLAACGDTMHESAAMDAFDGTLSGAWNYSKEPMMEHILAWKSKDLDKAREIWNGGLRALQMFVFNSGHQYQHYKAATWLHGLIPHPWMRAPYKQPALEDVRKLKGLMQACGIECIADELIAKEYSQVRSGALAAGATA